MQPPIPTPIFELLVLIISLVWLWVFIWKSADEANK